MLVTGLPYVQRMSVHTRAKELLRRLTADPQADFHVGQ
jgi:hypothetical protein